MSFTCSRTKQLANKINLDNLAAAITDLTVYLALALACYRKLTTKYVMRSSVRENLNCDSVSWASSYSSQVSKTSLDNFPFLGPMSSAVLTFDKTMGRRLVMMSAAGLKRCHMLLGNIRPKAFLDVFRGFTELEARCLSRSSLMDISAEPGLG